MPTPVYSLITGTTSGDTLASADVNALGNTSELFFVQAAELLGSGFFLASDFNATAVSGALALEIGAGSALVGDVDARKLVCASSPVTVTGLASGATNYLYLQRDGSFVANTSGMVPANTALALTANTNALEATSINNAPSGRTNLGQLLFTLRDIDGVSLEFAASLLRIKDGGVTSAKLAATAVTSGKLGASAVASGNLQDGQIPAIKLATALAALIQGTPTFGVGAAVSGTINVSVQLKDVRGANVSTATICRVWLSDAAGVAVTGTPPDGAVVIGTNGIIIDSHVAKTHLVVASNSAGAFDLNLSHSGTRTWYLNVEYQGKPFSSSAIAF